MGKKILIQFFIGTFFLLQAYGQTGKEKSSSASERSIMLFESDELLNISLRFNLTEYTRKKPKEEYLKAVITFHINEKDSVNKDIRLRSRGVFRNENCSLPPIELNFKKSDFTYTDTNKVSKIKLAVQCTSGAANENYILREYLVYRLFNVISDTSFRVRLLKINYIDTFKPKKPLTQFGFIIEPLEMVAARTNSSEVISLAVNQTNITPKTMNRVAIFNYMVGNYDWSVQGQHNVKVIKSLKYDPSGLGMAIPYDFDLTGLVNASYAIPSDAMGIKSIRDRLFLGICRTKEEFMVAIKEFSDKKEEFFKVINDFPYLNQNAKKDMINYLEEFFKDIDNQNTLIDIFLKNCKN
jgi:hypothetical protein